MSEDTNVIDFERRAAQARAMHTGYLVTELAGPTLKGIFDAAFIDARVDEDGDCIVRDDMTLLTVADPAKDVFKVYAFFPTSGAREQALEFCNRFNLHLVGQALLTRGRSFSRRARDRSAVAGGCSALLAGTQQESVTRVLELSPRTRRKSRYAALSLLR